MDTPQDYGREMRRHFGHAPHLFMYEVQCMPGPVFVRAPDKVRIYIFIMPISLPNPIFDHLLEQCRDDSNKWSNIGFGQEITQVESIDVNFTHLIWSSGLCQQIERVMTIVTNPRQYKIPDWFLNRQKDTKDGKFTQVSSRTIGK